MKVKILDDRITGRNLIPATTDSAGMDLMASIPNTIEMYPGDKVMIDTGIAVAIPSGQVGLIFPRSGLGSKGLILVNSVGVVDADYRGEVKVCLWNRNTEGMPFIINPLDRIAQIVIVPQVTWENFELVTELPATERGEGGFGSTGTK